MVPISDLGPTPESFDDVRLIKWVPNSPQTKIHSKNFKKKCRYDKIVHETANLQMNEFKILQVPL